VSDAEAGPEDLVSAIRARRGGTLLDLDRMLLHSPALARGWNAHLGAVRTGLGLDAKLLELAICRVAVLNGADYEFEQHLPLYLKAGGSESSARALRSLGADGDDRAQFSEPERAVLRLALEMTRDVSVSDDTFERVRIALRDDRRVVELVAAIATYNMVSRFLVALGIESEGKKP
jgi:alkylhydroperoxidase family enzyme